MKLKKKLPRQRSQHSAFEILRGNEHSSSTKDVDSDFEDDINKSRQQCSKDFKNAKELNQMKDQTTTNQWQYLDTPQSPWSNYLDQKFNRCSPLFPEQPLLGSKNMIWSDSQAQIVSNLIKESDALLEMFDQIALILGPELKLHVVTGKSGIYI